MLCICFITKHHIIKTQFATINKLRISILKILMQSWSEILLWLLVKLKLLIQVLVKLWVLLWCQRGKFVIFDLFWCKIFQSLRLFEIYQKAIFAQSVKRNTNPFGLLWEKNGSTRRLKCVDAIKTSTGVRVIGVFNNFFHWNVYVRSRFDEGYLAIIWPSKGFSHGLGPISFRNEIDNFLTVFNFCLLNLSYFLIPE